LKVELDVWGGWVDCYFLKEPKFQSKVLKQSTKKGIDSKY
jgi:hypothetical protein